MRISTGMIYDLGITSMEQIRNSQVKLQEQVGASKRILTPSDDPAASAAALIVRQSQALNSQLKNNGDNAKWQLGLEEGALSDTTTLLQDVKTIAVYAGNPTLSNADRATLAAELSNRYQDLLGIANRGDGNGQYLFSGYQGATQPFSETSPGNVVYSGDAGQRLAQIGTVRVIPVSDSGESIFRTVKNGNGTVVAAQGAANSGLGVISPATVNDPIKWNGATNPKDFTIKFAQDISVVPPITSYDIIDNATNLSLLTGAAPAAPPYLRSFVSGSNISLATQSPPDTNATPFDFGAMVTVTGTPASGDTFSIKASTNQDIFTTLHGLITTLQTPNTLSTATYQNSLNSAMLSLDNALNNVLSVRTDVGARLKAVESAQSTSDDLSLQYSKTLSGLEDLDYAKAISDLSVQQLSLQAAQQSFMKISSLNLFSLL